MNEDVTCRIIGQMDNTIDHSFESANRVYDKEGLCPTIPTGAGGGHTPKILTEYAMSGKTSLAEKRFFDIYNKKEVKNGVCITLTAHGNASPTTCGTVAVAEIETGEKMSASNPCYIIDSKKERVIVAQRGRNPENPKTRKGGLPTEQRLEVGPDGICNALTTVQKDNMVLERGEIIQGGLQEHQHPRKDGISPSITAACGMGGGQTPIFTERYKTQYRIRKLTPRECGRLMGVKDSDIDKMAAVNSSSQLYKQFGNSIVVDVMCAMFRKLNIKGVNKKE